MYTYGVYEIPYLGAEMANSFVFVGSSDPMVTSMKENNCFKC